jgi:hypothetical protein
MELLNTIDVRRVDPTSSVDAMDLAPFQLTALVEVGAIHGAQLFCPWYCWSSVSC